MRFQSFFVLGLVSGLFIVACAHRQPTLENQSGGESRFPSGTPTFRTVIPNNLDVPTDLVMDFTYDNRQVVKEVYKALHQINQTLPQPVQFHLLYPAAFVPLNAGGSSDGLDPKKEVESLKNQLQAEIGGEDALNFFSASFHAYLPYAWVQDLGEPTWVFDQQWKPSFLYFNPRNDEILKSKWPIDIEAIRQKDLPLENPYFMYASLNQIFSFHILKDFPKQKAPRSRAIKGEISR